MSILEQQAQGRAFKRRAKTRAHPTWSCMATWRCFHGWHYVVPAAQNVASRQRVPSKGVHSRRVGAQRTSAHD